MAQANAQLGGSMVAIVTPMHADGSVDWDSFEKLIDWHIAEGTDGIVAVGTTGESATLGFSEHDEVIERTVELVDKRVPVIAGTGGNATDEAIRLTRHAKRAGADACLLVCPYYNKPTQEGLYRHFHAIAMAVDIPQVLYNVPSRTGVDMLPETVARLAPIDNIVALKEAKGSIERIHALIEEVGDGIDIFSGDDGTAMESMLVGGKGDISVTANVAPRLMHEMCAAAVAGDREKAEKLDAQLYPLHSALFLEPNPIAVKWALYQMGYIGPGIRLPMTPLADHFHEPVRDALKALELIQ
ncbi:4-hydroxy-tetrahydrodipicolinate synthase protein [Salinisphaera shabanensis E1L3A]|uniref:4-hydroxy-tetrahydrodipicolinate synthase n=2 Tax=Salinisphaera shabanensis TaxID=180542 RepID=U2ELB4_9GAMM|nr:4-hydroxy-tetrahydrodipicolinate synthase [Salinisphaera shabanensis]ERJ18720.1 4-hydroxy-tetrahydrodipicolinate synthase protein [Salinisphaera shabanensis E1L3A]